MVNYTCSRCKRSWNRKSTYDDHLKRKNKCELSLEEDIDNHEDEIIMLREELALLRKQKDDEIDKLVKEKDDEIDKLTKEKDKEINDLKVELDKKDEIIVKLSKKVEKKNADEEPKINLCEFGKENYRDIISRENWKHLLKEGSQCISQIIRNIHFGKKMEYHNIYISNRQNKKLIDVFDGKKWVIKDQSIVMDIWIERLIDLVESISEEMKDEVNTGPIIRFLDAYSGNNMDDDDGSFKSNSFKKQVYESIRMSLWNERETSIATRRLMKL